MVTNCETADIFGVSNSPSTDDGVEATIAHGANWNDSPIFDNAYGADSFILRMESVIYYIGVGASGSPALFKRELRLGAMTNKELVEDVEDMIILYGEDRGTLDGIADTYVAAGSVTDMENVVSIRIVTNIRTHDDNISSVANNGDNRVRRNFTTTIGIRNRMS